MNREKESFFVSDKFLHFIFSMMGAILHPLFGLGLGLGKEFGDEKSPNNKWDWMDILADVVGVIVGGVVWYFTIRKVMPF